jgi:uncharacterized protein YjbI with pentapeptide repeats
VALAADAELEDLVLADVDASGSTLDGLRLDRCHLRGVALTGAGARAPRWRDVRLDGCELSGLRAPHAELHRVVIGHGRAMGLVLADATAAHVRIVECRLDGANLRSAELEQCVFERCSLVEADFSGAELCDVAFVGCDLTRAEFHQTGCERVLVERCTVDEVRGVAHLRGATVTRDAVLPLAMSAFAALGITVVDEPTDEPA